LRFPCDFCAAYDIIQSNRYQNVSRMAYLTLSWLGSFAVTLGGKPVTNFRSDKVRALLAYLAIEADRPHRREALAGLFWPNLGESAARDNLRLTLLRLRQVLSDPAAASQPYLLVAPKTLQFNQKSDSDLDVRAFTDRLAACQHHTHRQIEACPSCATRLEQATSLYRGDLLAGFFLDSQPFEEWLLVRREALRAQALQALHTLALYHDRQQNYAEVERCARQQLALESWREEAHCQLMRALALSGQRSAALAQYEACRTILAEELGAEPCDEARLLYAQILSDTPLTVDDRASALPSNLPTHLPSFYGRSEELSQIAACLEKAGCRLLSIVGPGGIGKTRLALQAAAAQRHSFPAGIYWLPIETIISLEQMIAALGEVVGLTFNRDQDTQAQLLRFLRDKELLLVLDNFERLAADEAVLRFVRRLLASASAVRLLVTSRQRLNLHAETLLFLDGLVYPDCPPAGGSIEPYAAMQLFEDRARQVHPGFVLTVDTCEPVARICRLVAGAPLGIELAAGWVSLFSPQEIARQIEASLDFLSTTLNDVPERQRSLRVAFEYSWGLLGPDEQQAFCRLAVFRGHFDRRAAEQVADAPTNVLADLAAHSLIHACPGDRLEIHPVLRQYIEEKLCTSRQDEPQLRQQHAAYYLDFIRQRGPRLRSAGQLEAIAEARLESSNLRAAWEWAVDHLQSDALADALEGFFLFHYMSSRFWEGERAFASLSEKLAGREDDGVAGEKTLLGRALACQGWFCFQLGNPALAGAFLQRSVAILREADAPLSLAFSLNYLGALSLHTGDYPEAHRLCEDGLHICRSQGDTYGAAIALNILGQTANLQHDYDAARLLCQESLTLAQELGNRWSMAFSLDYLGQIAIAQANYPAARRFFQHSLVIRREMGDRRGVGLCLLSLGDTAQAQGNSEAAGEHYFQAEEAFKAIGHLAGVYTALIQQAAIARQSGNIENARVCYTQALQAALDMQDVAKTQTAQISLETLGEEPNCGKSQRAMGENGGTEGGRNFVR
jgi:DNA-binding SARP family transcriptional activator/predicted ATPase